MFEGLGLSTKKPHTQPAVVDPKTGNPFNLKDPEFPVVDDASHHFRWSYWAMPKTIPRVMLEYLEDHWKYFNKTRFHGKLKEPNIRLLKDVNAVTMRLRGLWTPSKRELSISPNLFNAPHEGWVNRTLIHEMCHQSENEKYGEIDMTEKGHGHLWQQEMRLAGLPPSRFDFTTNETYSDKKEKEVIKKKKEALEPFTVAQALLKAERQPIGQPTVGMSVLFATLRGVIFGTITGKGSKAGSFSVEEVVNAQGITSMWTVNKKMLFAPNFRDQHSKKFQA